MIENEPCEECGNDAEVIAGNLAALCMDCYIAISEEKLDILRAEEELLTCLWCFEIGNKNLATKVRNGELLCNYHADDFDRCHSITEE